MTDNTDSIAVFYRERLEKRRQRWTILGRIEIACSLMRLAVFVSLLLLGLAWLNGHALAGTWLPLPLLLFLILIVAHDRAIRARRRMERAVRYFESGLERIEERWIGRGITGRRYLSPNHPYAADLDIFGRGSLFELLCTARAAQGRTILAEWLLNPSTPAELRRRHAAIRELTAKPGLQEDLATAEGLSPVAGDWRVLCEWGRQPAAGLLTWEVCAVAVLSLLGMVTLAIFFVVFNPLPLLVVIALDWLMVRRLRSRTKRVLDGVEAVGHELQLYSNLLHRLEREDVQAPLLRELRDAIREPEPGAAVAIQRLNRLLTLLEDGRSNLVLKPFAALLLWPIHFSRLIERWRQRHGIRITGWFDALGQMEALCALARYAAEHPRDVFPDLLDSGLQLEAEDLGHPLLPEARCVRNDLRLDETARLLIVSGSNMSGKSTWLRTIGISVVLAQAGAPVRARRMRLSPLAPAALLHTRDSLHGGISRFYDEILRLRAMLDMARAGQLPLLFLIDEMLSGTNSHDRRLAAEAILRELLKAGAVGLITTHDLALTELAAGENGSLHNVHFTDHLEGDRLVFDYRLRPGVVSQGNALQLMRSIGLVSPSTVSS